MVIELYKKFLPLIGMAIFIYLLIKIGIENIINVFFFVEIKYLIVAMFFIIPIVTTQTYKWNLLLRKQGMHADFIYLLKVWLIGWYYSVITPGRAGSFIRIIYLKEKINEPLGKCSSNILLDRFLDLFAVFTLATIGSILLINYFSSLFSTIFVVFIILASVFLFFTKKERSKRVLQVIYNILPPALKKNASQTFNSFYGSLPLRRRLFDVYLIALFSWILMYSQTYVVAQAFSINIPYTYFITIVPIATIIGLLPITISGLGTREAALITLFSVFNAAPATVIAFSLTGYIISNVLSALPGVFLALKGDLLKK